MYDVFRLKILLHLLRDAAKYGSADGI